MSMFKTRVTELLGIEYPIIAGAMGYISLSEFTAAVSNAGGWDFSLLPRILPWMSYARRSGRSGA
jgi:NAD(P)H-dependent flavin oxidoreductase YrpB (nitropropane dioxygenase family)